MFFLSNLLEDENHVTPVSAVVCFISYYSELISADLFILGFQSFASKLKYCVPCTKYSFKLESYERNLGLCSLCSQH